MAEREIMDEIQPREISNLHLRWPKQGDPAPSRSRRSSADPSFRPLRSPPHQPKHQRPSHCKSNPIRLFIPYSFYWFCLLFKAYNFYTQEASMAKYIVQQYIAAAGGETALNSIDSMYAMGKVRMVTSEFSAGEVCKNKAMKVKGVRHGGGEMGGFVLWQKRPELWCLELVVSGCKISAGSDGVVAWRQTPWHHSHASRGPPRPLRRALQVPFSLSLSNLFDHHHHHQKVKIRCFQWWNPCLPSY